MYLLIGNKNYSGWSLRAWLFMVKSGLTFDEIRVPLGTVETKDRILSYSNAGKVPVLYDDSLCIWDSLAICEYVSERYLAGSGWPKSPDTRAVARSYVAEMHSGFFNIRRNLPMNCRAQARRVSLDLDTKNEIRRVAESWRTLLRKYKRLGNWLFGNFTIVDAMFAPLAFRFRTYGIHLDEISRAYMNHVLADPAVCQWQRDSERETEVIEAAEVGCH